MKAPFSIWEGLLPEGAVVMARRSAASHSGVAFVCDEESNSGAGDSIQKLATALGLGPNDYRIFRSLAELDESFDFSPRSVVHFMGARVSTEWKQRGSASTYPFLELPSFKSMSEQPLLKKQAWQILKEGFSR